MRISTPTPPRPDLLSQGDMNVTFYYTGFVDPSAIAQPVTVTLTIEGDPNVVFVDTAGNELSTISWQQNMTISPVDYNHLVKTRIKTATNPPLNVAVNIKVTAQDCNGQTSPSPHTSIQYI